jgi:hypothetical protein
VTVGAPERLAKGRGLRFIALDWLGQALDPGVRPAAALDRVA